MSIYTDMYRRKLASPAQAVARVQDNDSLVHGWSVAEPPALLSALADRLHAGDLKQLRRVFLAPLRLFGEDHPRS